MKFRKPEPIPLLFIFCTTILLVTLAIWQVQRLQWKNHLVATVEKAQMLPALSDLPDEAAFAAEDDQSVYRRVELRGQFLPDHIFRVVGKPQWAKESGYSVLTPFKLENGKTVLVNRGWVPSGWKPVAAHQKNVSGVIRPARGKRYFSPQNFPEKNIWFYEDVATMSKLADLALPEMIVEEVENASQTPTRRREMAKYLLRNDHLGYAITWFALAIIGLMMFAAYHRIPENKA